MKTQLFQCTTMTRVQSQGHSPATYKAAQKSWVVNSNQTSDAFEYFPSSRESLEGLPILIHTHMPEVEIVDSGLLEGTLESWANWVQQGPGVFFAILEAPGRSAVWRQSGATRLSRRVSEVDVKPLDSWAGTCPVDLLFRVWRSVPNWGNADWSCQRLPPDQGGKCQNMREAINSVGTFFCSLRCWHRGCCRPRFSGLDLTAQATEIASFATCGLWRSSCCA